MDFTRTHSAVSSGNTNDMMSGSPVSSMMSKGRVMDVSFLCDDEASFSRQSSLLSAESGEFARKQSEEHFCKRCLKMYDSEGQFRRHVLQEHRANHKTSNAACADAEHSQYGCPVCGRTFGLRHNMLRHVDMVHRNRRPHDCKLCGKAFMTRSCVRRHMFRRHQGEAAADGSMPPMMLQQ